MLSAALLSAVVPSVAVLSVVVLFVVLPLGCGWCVHHHGAALRLVGLC